MANQQFTLSGLGEDQASSTGSKPVPRNPYIIALLHSVGGALEEF